MYIADCMTVCTENVFWMSVTFVFQYTFVSVVNILLQSGLFSVLLVCTHLSEDKDFY